MPAIQIQQVHKRFGAVQALSGIDLKVAQGEFFGLLGPNGAGKTTLINILAGLARADSGSVRVMGHDVIADYRASRRALGVVPQELVFDPFFSVRETLRIQSGYFGLKHNDAWIDEVMHHLDLAGKAGANMRSLSGGMKRRVLVAQALVHKPPVIVLDEPTAGVDVELRQGLWEFVRGLNRDGHTIVLTTHYLEEAEALCARIAMLKQGRIVALDTTSNLVNRWNSLYLKLRIAGAALPAALAARVRDSRDAVHTLRLRSFAEVEGVLAQVREAGARIEELELLQPDLEDVFVQIMNMEDGGERRGGRSASCVLPAPASPNR
ncbi:MAG: ABC transporter ATP-binding protein [Betaproteobacteria bacterium]|nr:ABC transporter ATP-binding protein [Betaproteobacteria bacterium]